MTSSLATQLAQGASLNSFLLIDRSKRKHAESYLFTGKEANHHDLYSVHALALNGFMHLRSINSAFGAFEQTLFSDAAKSVDRTLLTKEKAEELSLIIGRFLKLLGPYVLDAPSGKILEWLVRRFRINEFNVNDALALFLPYHETPHFAKLLSILHIKPQSTWHFLLAYKSAVKGLPRFALVTEMLKNPGLTRFVASLLPEALRGGYSYRTLINFHTATLVEYVSRAESFDPGSAVVFLSSFLEPLGLDGSVPKDAILSSFILLSVLAQASHLTINATQSIIKAIAGSLRHGIESTQVITAILSICAPQEKLSKIPRSIVKTLVESPDMAESVSSALGWAGSEKFLTPLLNPLVGRIKKPTARDLLTTILGSSKTPAVVVKELARILIESLPSQPNTTENKEQLRKLLAQLRQRHPGIFSEALSDVLNKSDEDCRVQIEQVILSLSVTTLDALPTSTAGSRVADLIVASADSDPSTRAVAVRGLLEGGGDKRGISAALISRTIDTGSTVLEALYSKPSALLPYLEEGYLDAISAVLSSPATPRQLIRPHVTFLLHHFVKAYPSAINTVVERCLWPFLLFTKARQKTCSAVWEIIESENCSHEVTDFQLLRGCLSIVREPERDFVASRDSTLDHGLQKLAAIDVALANRIADNIMLSQNPLEHVDFVLGSLKDENNNARTLGYLVARALLGKLSGKHQLSVAKRAIEAMAVETLPGTEDFLKGSDNLQSFINDVSLASCVVQKPGSKTTLNRLKVAVLALIPTIPRPVNSRIDWFNRATQPDCDTRGGQYVTLMATIYSLANAASAPPLLSAYLLRVLFISLKDDALIFLAGVWSFVPKEPNPETRTQIQLAALSHASAFLIAYEGEQGTIDFQTIVPPILAVLESTDQPVRAAAVRCLSVLGRLSQSGKPKAVYAFDTVYGAHSDQLQFLDWADFQRYILALVDQSGHLANDVDFLPAFHHQHLTKHKSDSKKDSGFKHRVICYLVSHAVACRLPHVRAGILKSLKDVPDSSKASMLIPVFKEWFGASEGIDIPPTVDQEFLVALVRAFDKNSAKALNDKEGMLWMIFLGVLRACSTNGPQCFLTSVFEETLKGGLFRKLSLERQIALCQFLLDLSSAVEAVVQCKSLLSLVLEDEPLVLNLLRTLQPVVDESTTPATKKARLDGQQSEPSFTADKLQPLTLLIEVIGGIQTFNGSKDLVVLLLDTLDRVVHCSGASAGQSDITYLEQLLMSVIGELADRLPSDSVSPTDIKFDVLIQIIRLSDNPQTFHQALLLISSLSHLAPEAVLRNVMPIFTFMGSSVLHRDDEYSFKVVQKTIDSVLPVMTSSLKSKHTSPIGLHVALRDFLSIFTDAANHIPRHRRISFFVHLTDVLGGAEFLAPISMLLVEKVAGRVVRQSRSDAQTSLSIPLSLLHHYGVSTQVQTLKDIVQESDRILKHAFKLEITEPTFLDLTRNDEDGSALVAAKRRSHALLLFVNYALQQIKTPTGSCASDILPLLLQISAVASAHFDEKQVAEIYGAARACLNSVLGVIPAVVFVSCVMNLLVGVEDKRIRSGALNLLAERVPKISDEVRNSSSSPVLKILNTTKSCLIGDDEEYVQSGLKAFGALARTMVPGEENAFTELIPTVLPLIHSNSCNESAMDALSAICTKLGPRVIPNLKAIISECSKLISSEVQAGTPGSSVSLKALRVLRGLLSTIPSFWTAEDINLVVDLYLLHDVATETFVMENLVKAVAKQVPSSVLIPTLCDTWNRLKESSATTSFGTFFLLLKKAIHAAPRGELLLQLRALFSVFLDGLAAQGNEETSDKEVEHETISSFLELVVKLNETTFKPLFRKLYDWAFTQESDERRRAVFCRVYTALLDYFKALMTPYMSFMMQPFIDLLETFAKSEEPDPELWGSLIQVLGKSFEVDEAAFWREDRLKQISGPLVSQIPIACSSFAGADGEENRRSLSNALCALAGAVSEDYDERGGGSGGALLKSLNLGILMHTRSEDVKQRIFSAQCATELWKTNGLKLVGFVAETSTFIAELAEDDNDTVVKETRKFKKAVEEFGGPVDDL